jgi:hypothetical protein
MKIITGTAGETPAQDQFPWFRDTECFVRLLWDLTPSDWRLVAFPTLPKNAYDPDEYLQARQILIQDISEVLLEVAPSVSFRIYLGESQKVVKMTPAPLNRKHAASWVDAIFATMQLQLLEEKIEENSWSPGEEQYTMMEIIDLRDKFYEIHPDLIPPEYENMGNYLSIISYLLFIRFYHLLYYYYYYYLNDYLLYIIR